MKRNLKPRTAMIILPLIYFAIIAASIFIWRHITHSYVIFGPRQRKRSRA